MASHLMADSIGRFFAALERHDLEEACRYTGGGFTVQAPGMFPLSTKDWMKAQLALWTAFPDLSYQAQVLSQTPSSGEASVQLQGTFLRDLALPFSGLPVYPATGERFSLPRERLGLTLEWGEILSVRSESPTALGLLGPIALAGATLPPPGIMG